MIADSQFSPRLTPNASIVYGRLARCPNELVASAELRKVLFISSKTLTNYVTQIRHVKKVDIEFIRGRGYILRSIQ